jgi:aryl-alcohol dehydrogenase-like predicted oxidoreductase
MAVSGYATPEGTARYLERLRERAAANHFRHEQNLRLSSIGIGTYLGNADAATDERYTETVMRAVKLGANVIDTAANYRFQRSERSIGAAIRQLVETETEAVREELVICTKGGYLPFDGEPPKDVRRYVEETFVRPGIIEFADIAGGSHCMTPAYLQSQIDQSLRNMNLAAIDVYYIHNPESQLGSVARDEFDKRLSAAFELLERNVADGRIRAYGAATWNGFRAAPQAREHLSLERMTELARAIGGDSHNFRFIQLPYNLAMPEAYVADNQMLEGERVCLLEAATALGVTVVASASLLQGKVARGLPEHVREELGSLATDAQTAIQFVRSTPGVTTALIGMSSREHVEENLQLVSVEPLLPEDFQRAFAEE